MATFRLSTDGLEAPRNQFIAWLSYVVIGPVSVAVASWIIAGLIFDSPHAFLATYGTGDLLTLAALILLGVAADIEHEFLFTLNRPLNLAIFKYGSVLLAILFFAFYGAIRGSALMMFMKPKLCDNDIVKLGIFSGFSIIALIAAMFHSIYSKSLLMNKQMNEIQQEGVS